ncbi:hypothetical protein [Natronosalvus halobius]|uniref:hypothetical protein n=1 Tax=Natronosalvus halobius TaxID=2953746 RepID=UPI00209DE00A|nr:hypothetical protein [Natronosalvus halobius]USZ72352.1 hypothetical protein NGM15_03305 [Natronosalvus halobius]
MTDSTTDEKSREGDFDIGPSMDELFGEIEDDSADDEPIDRDEPAHADDVEDVTAADLFSQLRDEAAANPGMDEVLEDESPEEIIASADEVDEPDHDVDDELVDEGALDDLLLTGRTRSDEFLWVDSGDDSSSADDGDSGATEIDSIQGVEGVEDVSESKSGSEAEFETEPRPESEFDAKDEDRDNPDRATDSVDEPDSAASNADDDVDGDGNGNEDTPEPDTAARAERVDYSLESTASDEESALVVSDVESAETDLVPTDDESEDEDSSGFLGWLRSKLPF